MVTAILIVPLRIQHMSIVRTGFIPLHLLLLQQIVQILLPNMIISVSQDAVPEADKSAPVRRCVISHDGELQCRLDYIVDV